VCACESPCGSESKQVAAAPAKCFFYSLLLLRGQTKNIKSWGGMRREIEGGMGYKGPQPNKIQKSFRQFRADALMNNRQPYCCLFFDSERPKLRTLKKKNK